MSKGLTCDICRKTTTVADFDRTVLPAEFTGWYHIGVSRRVVEDGNPFDKLQYREVDICPKCVEKIQKARKFVDFESGMYDGENPLMLDLIGEIFR